MAKHGYVIARSQRSNKEFFTSSSSYDKPVWISLEEATIYASADLAQSAVSKLFKYGAFSATIIPLSELAVEVDPRDADLDSTENSGSEITLNLGSADQADDLPPEDEVAPEDDMVADDQESLCVDCEHEPCTCPEDDVDGDGIEDVVDDEGTPIETLSIDGQEVPVTRESVNEAEYKEVEVKDPAAIDDAEKDAGTDVAGANDDKIKVPASVMTSLRSTLEKFNNCSDYNKTHNDERSSFCMTVAAATQTLIDDLSQGTVEGLKMAQVHLSSFMSPITNQFAPVVIKFIQSGGAKTSLKNMYDERWAKARNQDGVL